jgi:hypothetical protein
VGDLAVTQGVDEHRLGSLHHDAAVPASPSVTPGNDHPVLSDIYEPETSVPPETRRRITRLRAVLCGSGLKLANLRKWPARPSGSLGSSESGCDHISRRRTMDLWLAALIISGAVAVSATVMLLVRRRAPAGTYFRDVVPAGAVYTVVGTAYMVIVAFVFFVAFESYHAAKSDAQDEATATLGMFHLANLLSPKARDQLEGQLICYAREVVSNEWPAMRQGRMSPTVEARVTALEETAEKVPLTSDRDLAAYDHWVTLSEDRRKGRQGRISEASPLVPPVLWLILIIGGVVVIASVCLFADVQEAWFPQAAQIAAVAILVVSGLMLVRFLDKPYENKNGSIKPTAMTRTLALMETEHAGGRQAVIPCA